jgi:outer membrane protein assembly factor BamA
MRLPFLTAALAALTLAATAQPAAPADSAFTPAIALPTPAPQPLGVAKTSKFGQFGNLRLLPIPVIFYQAETGVGYGLGALLSGRFGTDTLTRPSNARAQYWTTQKGQSLLQLVHSIYTPGEKFYLNGEVSAYDLSLYYYGIGNDNDKSAESDLQYKLFIINQRVQKQIVPKLFFGAQYRLTNLSQITFEPGRIDEAKLTNSQALVPNTFLTDPRLTPRERQDTRVSGLGPVLTYDSRDVPLAAFRGDLLDFGVTFNGTGLGSDYRFVRYQLDARHFQPLGSNRTILALQYLTQLHTGDVPFRELAGLGANLGGSLYNNANLLRGLYEQRYRDRQMMMFQAEIRQKLFPNAGSSVLRRFDAAIFGGIGQAGAKVGDFTGKGTLVAGGGGIRFNFIRADRVNLRLDYAGGTGTAPGIYFAIGEAF